MSTFSDFPGLFEADRRAEKAIEVLKSAIEHLHPPRDGEDWAAVARRLRAAASLAHTASFELAVVSGWNEAASRAAHETNTSGLLDEDQ